MFNILEKLPSNILNNLNYLKEDFAGISFNFPGITLVIINLLFAVFLFLILYLLGNKMQNIFVKKGGEKNLFANFALGYILFGTVIAILGILSILYLPVLYVFYLLVVAATIFPLKTLKVRILGLNQLFKQVKKVTKTNKWVVIAIGLFVLIGFLRLIIPETSEDAVGYHTKQPRMYLANHTTMLESKEIMQVMYYPQLSEILYLATYSLGIKDASRYIHFGFYLLILLFLFSLIKQGKDSFLLLVPLLFSTSSVVIRVTSSANADFQWVFCILVSLFILFSNKTDFKTIGLSGIIFGGALATKLWVLAYLPILLVYLFLKTGGLRKKQAIKFLSVFFAASLMIPLIWYLRAFIWTGNPVYPVFERVKAFEETNVYPSVSNYLGINLKLFEIKNLIVFSPLFFLGVFYFSLKPFVYFKKIKQYPFFSFAIIIFITHLFLSIWVPRYNLFLFIMLSMVFSIGISLIYKNLLFKLVFVFGFLIIFFYYFSNTILTLPYAFGWADQNKYLTRVLARDNSSYYDFGHKFGNHILNTDLVATYNVFGFYYADFAYLETEYVFDEKGGPFENFKKKGVTKFFVRGGDMEWFCKRKKIEDCDPSKYELLSKYTAAESPRYLYLIK